MKEVVNSKIETLKKERELTVQALNELAADINSKTSTKNEKEKYFVGIVNQLAAYTECLGLMEGEGDETKVLELEDEQRNEA